MFIDTHAHINHEMLANKQEEILKSIGKDLKVVICPSYDVKTCHSTLDFANKYEKVFGALAIHPSEDKTWGLEIKKFIQDNLSNKKIVAVGEYGLDYHYQPYDKQKQQNVMLEQLAIAKQANLPSIFHVRDAFDDFIPIMKENLKDLKGGVVHCYDSDINNAKKLLDLGLFISFTGLITYKQNEKVREVIKYMPIDRIMLETDSPFLAPEPYRGQVCVPKLVAKVYEKVAEIKKMDMEELQTQMEQNVKKFFKKLVI